jgi:hypothetical protein
MVDSAILNADLDLASWGARAVLRTDGFLHGGGGAVTLLLKKNGRSGKHVEIAATGWMPGVESAEARENV